MTTINELARMIDHSLLHPTMTDADILNGCAVARKYRVATVWVKPYAVRMYRDALGDSDVQVCSVIGFPHGSNTTAIKVAETIQALQDGATEIDVVINIDNALGGDWDFVWADIEAVNQTCVANGAMLKVIFETDYLKDEHIVKLCQICSALNVAFVKTSSGYGFVKQPNGDYNYLGATEHVLKLMRRHSAPEVQLKAAGGVRNLDQLLKVRELGCTRSEVAACWFDPRPGETTTPENHTNTGLVQFAPPDEGAERDRVLILNAARPPVDIPRPRVVVLSDFPPIDVIPGTYGFGLPEKISDPDDIQSMIRLLVYANDLEIEGLIASAATLANVANKQGILDVLDLYDRVDENLRRHDPRFPTADHLRSVTSVGRSGTYARPAQEIIGPGLDSEASEAIIAAVDRPDPRPLWVLAWTGPRELAQALWKIRETRSPAETAQFVRKIRVYLIALQDGTGQWLLDEFPDLFIIHSAANWTGMIFYTPGSDSRLADLDWLNRNVRKGHGLLGLCYPESGWEHDALGVKEGDSPSFLHLLSGVRGLNDPEQPDQPGWGGRFVLRDPTRNHWTDDPEGPQTVWRWREQVQADFAARMDWCLDA